MNSFISFMAASIFFAAGIVSLRLSKRAFYSYFSPTGLFSAVWLFSLGLFYLPLLDYFALRPTTLLAFFMNILAFLFGSANVRWIFRGWDMRKPLWSPFSLVRHGLTFRATILLLFSAGVIGTLTYYFYFHTVLPIESLWIDPQQVRFEESLGQLRRVGYTGVLRNLLPPAFVLCVIYLQLPRLAYKRWFAALAFFCFLAFLPSSSRTGIATLIVWGGLAVVYARDIFQSETFRQKRVLIYFLYASLLFLPYFIATSFFLGKTLEGFTYVASFRQSFLVSALAIPYHYLVAPFVGFQQMINYPELFSDNGSLTLGFAARILHQVDPNVFAYPDYLQPFVETPFPTNVYTYLGAFYIDFGWLGILLIPFLLGTGTSVVYLLMRRSPTVMRVYVASLLGLCIVSSTGVNRFGTFETFLWIVVPVVVFGTMNILTQLRSSSARKLRPSSNQEDAQVVR